MKKITGLLLLTGLLFTTSAFAVNYDGTGNMNGMGNGTMMGSGMMTNNDIKDCPYYKTLSADEKAKLDAMTKDEQISYMREKMGTGSMMMGGGMMMCGGMMMGNGMGGMHNGKMGDMNGNGMMNRNNKTIIKINDSLNNFFDKLDKEVTDNTKKIEKLNMINSKIDTILTNTTLTDTKKQIYTHIKNMILEKINEIDSSDINLDGLLNTNQ